MKIGIIGAGHIGATLARLWAHANHDIIISSRHPSQLQELASRIGDTVCADSLETAARIGEIVTLAIPLGGIVEVGSMIEPFLDGKVLIDVMNPFPERDGDAAREIMRRKIAAGIASRERFPSASVVRAFSSIHYADLQKTAHRGSPRIAVPFSADTERARSAAAGLIIDAGFDPYYLGSLADSRPLDPGGDIFGKALTVSEIDALMESRGL